MTGVIFLNIDGVLTTARTSIAYSESNMRTLDPVSVRMIASICKQSNMKICISSDWKNDTPLRADFVLKFAFNGGMPLIRHIFKGKNWCTPTYKNHDREDEILSWLEDNPTSNIIVIDHSDLGCNLERYLVKSFPYEGFSFENYLETVKIIEENALLSQNDSR